MFKLKTLVAVVIYVAHVMYVYYVMKYMNFYRVVFNVQYIWFSNTHASKKQKYND